MDKIPPAQTMMESAVPSSPSTTPEGESAVTPSNSCDSSSAEKAPRESAAQPSGDRAKFWADDFDMDLLKLFPQLPQMLGATADVKLWTVGHERYGRLNHPVVWNTHGAFFWTKKPNLSRDRQGWFNVNGCVDDAQEIECTWLEVLRDQWPHSYAFTLNPVNVLFDAPPSLIFHEIMYDLRGIRKSQNIERARGIAQMWFLQADITLQALGVR